MKQVIIFLSLFLCIGCSFGQIRLSNGNQRAFYECRNPIDIDSNLIEIKNGKVFFQLNTNQKPTNLKSKDFYGLEDNPKDYFTAYLVNSTDTTFAADKQDGSLIMIQEALDKNGHWQPIEYWVYSGCGNSYFNPLKLESGKCVLIPIKKYSGNFNTQIRLKFKYGKEVMYSDSFNGKINISQFKKVTKNVNGILYHGPADYFE